METIKQAIYNALGGDKQKIKLFGTKSNEARIVKIRSQVFLILAQKGYSLAEITEEVTVCKSTVYRGIQHALGNKTLKRVKPISSELIARITLGKDKMSKGALYDALIKQKIARKTILRHFNISMNFLKNEIVKEKKIVEREAFEAMRKKIIKF